MGALAVAAMLVAQPTAAPAEPYRAFGSDPAWSLVIAEGQLRYESPGRPPILVPAPRPVAEPGQISYSTRRLSVDILRVACEDEGSGRRYPDSVMMTVEGRLLAGCGGTVLSADSLDGTSWHFAEIAGDPIPLSGDILRDDIYAVDFSAEAFVGYGGCNRFSARYSRTGDMLTAVQPMMSTRRACPQPAMGREQRLFAILAEPVRIGFPDPDTLLLTGNGGAIRLRRTRSD